MISEKEAAANPANSTYNYKPRTNNNRKFRVAMTITSIVLTIAVIIVAALCATGADETEFSWNRHVKPEDDDNNFTFPSLVQLFNNTSANINHTKDDDLMALPAEPLPTPEKQIGSAYVAYIPIPMKNSDDDEEYQYEDEEDEEYYDDYEDDEDEDYEYEDEEDEMEYYEDDDEDEDVHRRRWGSKRPPSRTISESRKYRRKYRPRKKSSSSSSSSLRRRKNKRRKRLPKKSRRNQGNGNSVPFLVPLMMVPPENNNEEDEERFSDSRRLQRIRGYRRLNRHYPGRRRHHRYIPQHPHHPRRRFQVQQQQQQQRRRRPFGYNPPPPFPNLHRMPGPPYPGPAPRAPNKPLDQTRIHPSTPEEVFELPPKEFTSGEVMNEDEDDDKSAQSPTVIVVQQPAFNPYMNLLAGSTPEVDEPGIIITSANDESNISKRTGQSVVSIDPSTNVISRIPAPDRFLRPGPPGQRRRLPPPRRGMPPRGRRPVPPVPNNRRNFNRRRNHDPVGQRRSDSDPEESQDFNPTRRNYQDVQGIIDDEFRNKFDGFPPRDFNEMKHPPNIFRRGVPLLTRDDNDSPNTVYVEPPPDYNSVAQDRMDGPPPPPPNKPMIRRPPPKHPGVKIPGVSHPPDSGSIQDIIHHIDRSRVDGVGAAKKRIDLNAQQKRPRPPPRQNKKNFKPFPGQPPVNRRFDFSYDSSFMGDSFGHFGGSYDPSFVEGPKNWDSDSFNPSFFDGNDELPRDNEERYNPDFANPAQDEDDRHANSYDHSLDERLPSREVFDHFDRPGPQSGPPANSRPPFRRPPPGGGGGRRPPPHQRPPRHHFRPPRNNQLHAPENNNHFDGPNHHNNHNNFNYDEDDIYFTPQQHSRPHARPRPYHTPRRPRPYGGGDDFYGQNRPPKKPHHNNDNEYFNHYHENDHNNNNEEEEYNPYNTNHDFGSHSSNEGFEPHPAFPDNPVYRPHENRKPIPPVFQNDVHPDSHSSPPGPDIFDGQKTLYSPFGHRQHHSPFKHKDGPAYTDFPPPNKPADHNSALGGDIFNTVDNLAQSIPNGPPGYQFTNYRPPIGGFEEEHEGLELEDEDPYAVPKRPPPKKKKDKKPIYFHQPSPGVPDILYANIDEDEEVEIEATYTPYRPPNPPPRPPKPSKPKPKPTEKPFLPYRRPPFNLKRPPSIEYNLTPSFKPNHDHDHGEESYENLLNSLNDGDYIIVDEGDEDLLQHHVIPGHGPILEEEIEYDVNKPDGPDYTTATYLDSPLKTNKLPVNIGLDVYPLHGVDELKKKKGRVGNKPHHHQHHNQHDKGNNKHELLLHLNLYSKKPGSGSNPYSFRSPEEDWRKKEADELLRIYNDRMYHNSEQGPIIGKGYGFEDGDNKDDEKAKGRKIYHISRLNSREEKPDDGNDGGENPLFGQINPVNLIKMIVDHTEKSNEGPRYASSENDFRAAQRPNLQNVDTIHKLTKGRPWYEGQQHSAESTSQEVVSFEPTTMRTTSTAALQPPTNLANHSFRKPVAPFRNDIRIITRASNVTNVNGTKNGDGGDDEDFEYYYYYYYDYVYPDELDENGVENLPKPSYLKQTEGGGGDNKDLQKEITVKKTKVTSKTELFGEKVKKRPKKVRRKRRKKKQKAKKTDRQ